jgi:hypothetical protein
MVLRKLRHLLGLVPYFNLILLVALFIFGLATFTYASDVRLKQNVNITEVAAEVNPDSEVAAAIRRLDPNDTGLTYHYNYVDLNSDGSSEVIVWAQSMNICGSCGCLTVILENTGQGYQSIGNFDCTGVPVIALNQSTNGWQDIAYSNRAGYQLLKFDGSAYQET